MSYTNNINKTTIIGEYISVELTNNKYALIDKEDLELINRYKWHCVKVRNMFYAMGSEYVGNYKTKHFCMHRIIMDAKKGIQVDHINRNGLDNRKANLRPCNNMQNNQNKGPQKNNKVGLKGVSINHKKKYIAMIQIPNGKYKLLGRYDCPTAAGLAYDRAAKMYFGEFAYLNFK